jgi:hypothetical protein
VTGRSACVFYGRTGPAYNWPPASIFYGGTGPDSRTDGRTDRRTGFLRETGEVGASPSSGFLLCAWVRLSVCDHWTQRKVTGKLDAGEKWREKDKTTVGWRAFDVLKPRSWEWNPVPVYRGPETQVLRVKPSVRLWRSWNPGPQSRIPRSWNPMSWEPKAATRACRHGRIVSDRHRLPLVKIKNTLTKLKESLGFIISTSSH